jgi:CBS domain-containing protein
MQEVVMKARDVMTWGVISVETDASVERAAQLMLQNRISGLPVVDSQGALVGVVTEGDFLRRREIGTKKRRPRWLEFLIGPGRLANEYVHAAGRQVSEIMTPDPYTVSPETGQSPAAILLQNITGSRFAHVPYRGNALALQDLLAGRIDFYFADMSALPQVQAGTLRSLRGNDCR